MTTSDLAVTPRLAELLTRREQELLSYLRASTGMAVASGDDPAEMRDFKDLAAQESRVAVDAKASDHAARELSEIRAAQRRIDEGTYGLCLDCGDPIDEKRLLAMPASLYCCSCQSVHERPRPVRR